VDLKAERNQLIIHILR